MISNALRIAAGMLLLSCFGCTSANRTASIEMKWDPRHTQQPLAISNDGLTLSWERDSDSNWRLCRCREEAPSYPRAVCSGKDRS